MRRGNGFKDLTGKRFGRLVVKCIDEGKTKPKHIYWKCECDCGNTVSVSRAELTSGTKSCGCLQREIAKESGKQNKKDFNGCTLVDNHYEMNINGKIILFDIDDYDIISKYHWRINGKYVYAWDDGKPKPMHRIIFGDFIYDHINHNPFDNRRNNLRKCTSVENNQNISLKSNNTSGVTGVGLDSRGRWRARVTINKKRKTVYVGWSFEDAVKARLKAEKEYYGEFAPQQHLYKQYGIE